MRSYEERAKDFIQEVFPYISKSLSPYETRWSIDDFNAEHNRKVIVSNGIARIALITSDYVVKFDYDPDNVKEVGGGEAEISMYAEAERDGFAYLFAKVTRYEYHGRKFYIMPRINGISDENYHYAEHYMTETERKWCRQHHLTDLHCNNYGFRNGHVCVVDYACTYDSDECSYSYSSYSSYSSV